MIAPFAIALAAGLYAMPAQAAVCPRGYIYRPSRNVCSPAQRYAKASIRHRAKRAPAPRPPRTPRARQPAPVVMTTSPMWYVMEPNPFREPYGRLVLPLANYDPRLAAWASLRLWSVEP